MGILTASLLGICAATFAVPGQQGAEPTDKPAPAANATSQAQQAAPIQDKTAPSQEKAPELTTQESQPTFRLKVNLVLVRVVVRDANGRAIGNLHREDFRLFDNGKPQVITQFTIDSPASKAAEAKTARREASAEAPAEAPPAPDAPQRYLGLYFDDVHIVFADLSRVRAAAERYLGENMQSTDRVGIFTSSGQNQLEFGDDRAKIQETLSRMMPRPIVPKFARACPDIDHYQAYQIITQNDGQALEVAAREILHCLYQDNTQFLSAARGQAVGEAQAALNAGETEVDYSLRGLQQLVRVMAALPGQRNIVLVSPGFFALDNQTAVNEIIDRAVRAGVIINALDARGLYTPEPFGDVSEQHVVVPQVDGMKTQLRLSGMRINSDVMADLSSSTGGAFFENSNDLDAGFRRAGALPEFSYVLGFSPVNQKLDGRFHELKVKLATPAKFTVQARRGYYAPKKAEDQVAAARQEIEEALFSQDELSEVPIDVHTQFFKSSDADAKLSVLARLDMRFVHYHKEAGRNMDNLTVVAALFDRNGKYISAEEKTIQLRLFDTTRERLARTGLNTKTSFAVKPGTYLVRLVVRDEGGASISAQNRTVEIP